MTTWKKISVNQEMYDKLMDDKEFFKATIGGNWSINDVLREYYKIMPKKEAKILHKSRWMKWETFKKMKTKVNKK